MKRFRAAAGAAFFAAAFPAVIAAAADEPPTLFVGRISDSECGLDHARMKKEHHLPNDLSCNRDCCVKYKQEYVLADHASGDVDQLDDQKAASRYPNRIVRVLGTLDAESGTIHVKVIEPVR